MLLTRVILIGRDKERSYLIINKLWPVNANLFDCLKHIDFIIYFYTLTYKTGCTKQTTLAGSIPGKDKNKNWF